jgi:hypothetical protein
MMMIVQPGDVSQSEPKKVIEEDNWDDSNIVANIKIF